MAKGVEKICGKCGKPFFSPLVHGQVSSTVNCPSCRRLARGNAPGALSPVRTTNRESLGYTHGKTGAARVQTMFKDYHRGYDRGAAERG